MGISGLLPLLKSIHKPCDLKKFAGQTIGVDAYGWLHRGAVASALDIALGKPTRKYVDFSMHRVRMLQHFGVTPFLVFDGDYLPSKAATEQGRSQKREESRRTGLELYALGKTSQAYLELQKAVDVTPEMARHLIEELKRDGVQYIVAPYEADAQLVYLERTGFVSGIVSEDSDLLVFGAKCLLTKLDQYGNCVAINRADFAACKDVSLAGWSQTDFRRMAILSGCDYLRNMNKVGLRTAYRMVRKYKTIDRIVKAVQFDGQFMVPPGYLEAFIQAELTFLHQRVFCPVQKKLVMHTQPEEGTEEDNLTFLGQSVPADVAIGVAYGDLHPMTKEPLVVEPARQAAPQTPWMGHKGNPSKVSSMDSVPMKGGQSIESFFKSKRTPLAELDPNSFTPSPSQQRVLWQHSNSSWSSSPISEQVDISPAIPTPASHSAVTPARPTTRPAWTKPVPVPRPQKRPRLCSSEEDKPFCAQSDEVGKSRFFTSSTSAASPMGKTPRHKSRNAEFHIFSDDSIEDAMASLPDGFDSRKSPRPSKLNIFEDEAPRPPRIEAQRDTAPIVQKTISRTPTPAASSPHQPEDTSIGASSSPTNMVSESPRNTVKGFVQPDFNALRGTCKEPSSEASNAKSFRAPLSPSKSSSTPKRPALLSKAVNTPVRTPDPAGRHRKAPLKDLNSQTSEASYPRHLSSTLKSKSSKEQSNLNSASKAPAEEEDGCHSASILLGKKKQDRTATVAKSSTTHTRVHGGGSEDMIVPDSDADDDEWELESGCSNDDNLQEKTKAAAIDLNRFLFRAGPS